jgi:UV DNA damage endonuclease
MPGSIVRVGFACVTYSLGLTTNHQFRLANLGEDRLRETVRRNLDDLEAILNWMKPRGLRLFRIGSSLVPLASHPLMKIDWVTLFAERLHAIGQEFEPLGFRFSMHPGQYNVLNSPRVEVARQAAAELDYSCKVLDLMGLGSEHKVVLHGGGVYGNRGESLQRLESSIAELPQRVKRRLVLENDERHYTFAQIAELSSRTSIPAVFDWHHHQINPSDDIERWLRHAHAVWDCRPKVHLSSQKPGAKPGAHDMMIHPEDLLSLLDLLPFDADLMVEAKSKEVAALEVLGHLSNSLRP